MKLTCNNMLGCGNGTSSIKCVMYRSIGTGNGRLLDAIAYAKKVTKNDY